MALLVNTNASHNLLVQLWLCFNQCCVVWDLLAKYLHVTTPNKACMHHNIAWGLLAKLLHITTPHKACMLHNIAWGLVDEITAYYYSTQGLHAS